MVIWADGKFLIVPVFVLFGGISGSFGFVMVILDRPCFALARLALDNIKRELPINDDERMNKGNIRMENY